MQLSLALLASVLATAVSAQGVTELITPSAPPPPGCGQTKEGTFGMTIVNVTQSSPSKVKRDLRPRQTEGQKPLQLTLQGGILKDAQGRTGYIASNFQYQFDGPPQAGAIYTGGFSVCSNGTIALGGSAIWYQCLSGNFYNLYDRPWAEHCIPCYFEVIGGSGSGAVDTSAKPIIATATATANATSTGSGETSSTGAASLVGGGSSNSTASNSTVTSTSETSTKTGSSTSASNSVEASATGTSGGIQVVPSAMTVLAIALFAFIQL